MNPTNLHDLDACVDRILATVGNRIVLGIPLGIGKPNRLVNALYRRAKADRSISLEILTALSLERPQPNPGLEERFMRPFIDRVFGSYEELDYMADIRAGTVPENIRISEFFFKSGALLGNEYAQRNYICTNYTYAPRDLLLRGINVVAQLVARREEQGKVRYSLSCNPEVTLDMYPELQARKQRGEPILSIAVPHEDLPFMLNDAEVPPEFFDLVLDEARPAPTLFGAPNLALNNADYAIGLHASALIRDGGTLQIGIGALGDAIVHACRLRHHHNDAWRRALGESGELRQSRALVAAEGGLEPFREGLYGSSEMFVSGFFELMKAGILKRRVYDHPVIQKLLNERRISEQVNRRMLELLVENGLRARLTPESLASLQRFGVLQPDVSLEGNELLLPDGSRVPANLDDETTLRALGRSGLGDTLRGGIVMHGGFFLGPPAFYRELRALDEETRRSIGMTRISYVNALYGEQDLKHAQRRDARFINTVFTATLMGAAVSDGLPDGQVVSGVGGQYNFVAMAHELPGARSILLLRATRSKGGEVTSNIVWNYGHITIPRHLRDIFITEYGIADLRGKTDEEVIIAMLKIADSRFQDELMAQAKAAGKLRADYELPAEYRQNTPEAIAAMLGTQRELFPPFPFGHDFTEEELVLGQALKKLRAVSGDTLAFLQKMQSSLVNPTIPDEVQPYLARMGMTQPETIKDKVEQLMLVEALREVLGLR